MDACGASLDVPPDSGACRQSNVATAAAGSRAPMRRVRHSNVPSSEVCSLKRRFQVALLASTPGRRPPQQRASAAAALAPANRSLFCGSHRDDRGLNCKIMSAEAAAAAPELGGERVQPKHFGLQVSRCRAGGRQRRRRIALLRRHPASATPWSFVPAPPGGFHSCRRR